MTTDLTNCDREPIHTPGSIQPHGFLLACDSDMQRVVRHSVNAPAFLTGLEGINFRPLDEVIGGDLCHDLRNALSQASDPGHPGLLFARQVGSHPRLYDISAHRHLGNIIIEFETSTNSGRMTPIEFARAIISRIQGQSSVTNLVERVPRRLMATLGYDRVMVYRFAEDGSGKVISEAKQAHLESFLGQHFPASDIPRQARVLYLKNKIRLIGDASAETVPIDPVLDEKGELLDLSFAHLRSVSPIHTEYLRNMGVAASMSISILVGGELWGLIACHHYTPRHLPMAQRIAAEMFGEVFSLKLETMHQRESLAASMRARSLLDKLIRDLTVHENMTVFMHGHLPEFLRLLPADGVGVFMDGTWASHGSTPPKTRIAALARYVGQVSEGKVWASHELPDALPDAAEYAAEAAGVLAVPLSQQPRDFLFFFRKEQVQTIEWAGNPDKQYSVGKFGDRLTPRKSFAVWKETVERQSLPWTPADRQIAEAARMQLLEILLRHTEVLASERRKAEVRHRVLNEELTHRVKNILSLIKSLVSQPIADGSDLTDYVGSLKGRIMALSFAHDQVVRSDGGGSFRDLLEAELSPYAEGGAAIELDGPDIALDARAHAVMALVLHELATNAAKYGALSRPNARLHVAWSISPEGSCTIRWEETGGPAVVPPSREGFGSVLLNRSIPFDLGGRSDVAYLPAGVQAVLEIPGKFVFFSMPRATPAPRKLNVRATKPDLLTGKRVLLVEDQLVIALDAERMLDECGAAIVLTASTHAEALRFVATGSFDAAVLDVNLGEGNSFPIAEELLARGIPFVFATGYGDSAMVPPSLSSIPVVRKPFSSDGLCQGLAAAMPPDDKQ